MKKITLVDKYGVVKNGKFLSKTGQFTERTSRSPNAQSYDKESDAKTKASTVGGNAVYVPKPVKS